MFLHPSVDPSLTNFLGEFPGLGLALVPDVMVPEADIYDYIRLLNTIQGRNYNWCSRCKAPGPTTSRGPLRQLKDRKSVV